MDELVDYEQLAASVAAAREAINAMVMALKADGFTDREAREIVVALLRKDSDA